MKNIVKIWKYSKNMTKHIRIKEKGKERKNDMEKRVYNRKRKEVEFTITFNKSKEVGAKGLKF